MIANLALVLLVLAAPLNGEALRAQFEACLLSGKAQAHIQSVSGTVPVKSVTQGPLQLTEYETPTVGSVARSVVVGDRIWIPSPGDLNAKQNDRILGLSASGKYVSFLFPRLDCGLYTLRAASGGLWFVREFARTVGFLNFNGDFFEKPLARAASDVELDGTPYFDGFVEYGADGTRWGTSHPGKYVERQLSGSSAISRIQFKKGPETLTTGMVPDANGGAWFARYNNLEDKIIHVTRNGIFDVEASAPRHCLLNSLTAAAGAIWFSCGDLRLIGRVSASGAITALDLPYPASISMARVFGDPHGLWIVDFHRVFRLNITASPGPGNAPVPRRKGGA